MEIQNLARRVSYAMSICAWAFAALANAQSLAVLRGSQGCPVGSAEKFIYIDNEDSSNANSAGGWLGASTVGVDTVFNFCSVAASSFGPTNESYALLSLDNTCPSGAIRFRRKVDSNNNFSASSTTSDSNIPDTLFKSLISYDLDVWMTFCRFPATGPVYSSNPFPDLGVEYGVFAPSYFRYAKQTGALFMDDQDATTLGFNMNMWCDEGVSCTYETRNYNDIMDGGLNTTMHLALVRQCTGANLMPTLSGPTGSVTRSGAYSADYEAWKTFDSSSTSMWISAVYQSPAWIGYSFSAFRRISRYAITFANGSLTTRAPKDWTLQGWNGYSWVNIDTRSNQTNWGGFERREYAVASPGDYSEYRLNITDDNDSSPGVVVVSIGRLELSSCN